MEITIIMKAIMEVVMVVAITDLLIMDNMVVTIQVSQTRIRIV